MQAQGQAAIEFIFLILIVVVYLTTVTIPLTHDAQNSLTDVTTLSRIHNESEKLVNAINEVSYLGEGSLQKVPVFIEEKTAIYCGDTNISFIAHLTQEPFPEACPDGNCQKMFLFPPHVTLVCSTQKLIGPLKTYVIISKTANGIIFAETS